jgi:hypothetical protein
MNRQQKRGDFGSTFIAFIVVMRLNAAKIAVKKQRKISFS